MKIHIYLSCSILIRRCCLFILLHVIFCLGSARAEDKQPFDLSTIYKYLTKDCGSLESTIGKILSINPDANERQQAIIYAESDADQQAQDTAKKKFGLSDNQASNLNRNLSQTFRVGKPADMEFSLDTMEALLELTKSEHSKDPRASFYRHAQKTEGFFTITSYINEKHSLALLVIEESYIVQIIAIFYKVELDEISSPTNLAQEILANSACFVPLQSRNATNAKLSRLINCSLSEPNKTHSETVDRFKIKSIGIQNGDKSLLDRIFSGDFVHTASQAKDHDAKGLWNLIVSIQL